MAYNHCLGLFLLSGVVVVVDRRLGHVAARFCFVDGKMNLIKKIH